MPASGAALSRRFLSWNLGPGGDSEPATRHPTEAFNTSCDDGSCTEGSAKALEEGGHGTRVM